MADLEPCLRPLSKQNFDLAGTDIVVNIDLHFDHCGDKHLFAGRPIHVQRRELDDARYEDGYTIREWVEAPGVRYVPVDGELELLPGLRLVPGYRAAAVVRNRPSCIDVAGVCHLTPASGRYGFTSSLTMVAVPVAFTMVPRWAR